jgi:hypothetical protein
MEDMSIAKGPHSVAITTHESFLRYHHCKSFNMSKFLSKRMKLKS